MPSMLRRLWILDTVLCSTTDVPVRTPSAQVLSFDKESHGGVITDGRHNVKVTFGVDIVEHHEKKGIPLEKMWGGIITLREFSLYLDINLLSKYAEFFFQIDDFVYHGGEGGILSSSLLDVHTEESVQSRMHSLLQHHGVMQGSKMVGSEQGGSRVIRLLEGLGLQSQEEAQESMWSQNLGSVQAVTQNTEELPSHSEKDAFAVSRSQQEVHTLLNVSRVAACPYQADSTSLTSKQAEGGDEEEIRLDSGSIALGGSGEACGLEVANSRAVLDVPPHSFLKGDAAMGGVEEAVQAFQGEPPAKKLRVGDELATNCNMEQVNVFERRKMKEKHDSADEFFISATQETALCGLESDQCNVFHNVDEGKGPTPKGSEWEAFSRSMPLCVQPVEEKDSADNSHHSTPIIDFVTDSAFPYHNSTQSMLHGDVECPMKHTILVSDRGRVMEGDDDHDHELTVCKDPSTERVQDNKPGGGVGATVKLEHNQCGLKGKHGEPLQTGHVACTAEHGDYVRKARIWSEEECDKKQEDTVVHENVHVDCEKGVKEYTDNDSDFQTAPSEVQASSLSTHVSLLPCSFASPCGEKGVFQTGTINTPVLVFDRVCEETLSETNRGLLDDFDICDSKSSQTAEENEENQSEFRIIVPVHDRDPSISSPNSEQDATRSSQVPTQQLQSGMPSSSISFTLISPEMSLPGYQVPHLSLSTDTSLLITMPSTITSTEECTQGRGELLTKIKAYWQRKHMESQISSDMLLHNHLMQS